MCQTNVQCRTVLSVHKSRTTRLQTSKHRLSVSISDYANAKAPGLCLSSFWSPLLLCESSNCNLKYKQMDFIFTCLARRFPTWIRRDQNRWVSRTIENRQDNCSAASCHATQFRCHEEISSLWWCRRQATTRISGLAWDPDSPKHSPGFLARNNLSEYKCWNARRSPQQTSQCSRVASKEKGK